MSFWRKVHRFESAYRLKIHEKLTKMAHPTLVPVTIRRAASGPSLISANHSWHTLTWVSIGSIMSRWSTRVQETHLKEDLAVKWVSYSTVRKSLLISTIGICPSFWSLKVGHFVTVNTFYITRNSSFTLHLDVVNRADWKASSISVPPRW